MLQRDITCKPLKIIGNETSAICDLLIAFVVSNYYVAIFIGCGSQSASGSVASSSYLAERRTPQRNGRRRRSSPFPYIRRHSLSRLSASDRFLASFIQSNLEFCDGCILGTPSNYHHYTVCRVFQAESMECHIKVCSS